MASEPKRAARSVVVAVDGSEASKMAVRWAATHVLRSEDDLHLAKAVSVPVYGARLPDDDPCAAADAEPEASQVVLQEASELAVQAGVPRDRIDVIMLPVSDSAPNAGAAVVAFANTGNFKVLVVGSQGMGAFKRAFMALLGTGSVSSYVVEHSELPVAVVRQDLQLQPQETTNLSRSICVAVDGSPAATAALEWALTNVVDPSRDVLQLVSVAVPPPPPVTDIGPATVVVMSYLEERQRAVADAQQAADAAATVAIQHRVPDDRIMLEALDPLSDGTGTVSGSILHYLSVHKVDAVVVGSRGLGSFRSAVLSMAGLGSVSSECVQRAPCPVVVMPVPPTD